MRNKNNHIQTLLILLCITGMLAGPTCADHTTAKAGSTITADGWVYPGKTVMRNGEVYVSLREFATTMDNAVVTWQPQDRSAAVKTDSLTMTAWHGKTYLIANERYLWCPGGTFVENGVMLVPLSAVARAFGFTTNGTMDGDIELYRVRGAIEPGEKFYDTDAVYWLAKIIHAEAQGEPFSGKVAVGEVVLNRVESDEFPDTIYGVIFDTTYGVQFTPTVNGAIRAEPGEESIVAAKLALDGARTGEGLLYFLNPKTAVSTWIPTSRPYAMTIGNHAFYR